MFFHFHVAAPEFLFLGVPTREAPVGIMPSAAACLTPLAFANVVEIGAALLFHAAHG